MPQSRTVREYIDALEKGKEERPDQVRQGLEIFVELWKKALDKGVVEGDDRVEDALEKLERLGGLYQAAEG